MLITSMAKKIGYRNVGKIWYRIRTRQQIRSKAKWAAWAARSLWIVVRSVQPRSQWPSNSEVRNYFDQSEHTILARHIYRSQRKKLEEGHARVEIILKASYGRPSDLWEPKYVYISSYFILAISIFRIVSAVLHPYKDCFVLLYDLWIWKILGMYYYLLDHQ